MCLAIPTQIVKLLDNQMALTSLSGVEKEISLSLLQEEVQAGDYVIVHVGHAIGVIDPEEAARTLALFAEMAEMEMATSGIGEPQ